MITNLEKLLAEVKELDERATKGPWDKWVCSKILHFSAQGDADSNVEYDGRFIARARTLLPKLAEIVEVFRHYTDDSENYLAALTRAEEIAGE